MLRSIKFWLVIIVVAIGISRCWHQRAGEKRLLQTSPIAAVPEQSSTSEATIERNGYRIQPVARYELRAVVLSVERYRFGREADLSPLDFTLGWGPMSDPAVFGQLQISQGNRWYNYRWSGEPPIAPSLIAKNSANTHLIPANEDVRRALSNVAKGDTVQLVGMLVDVEHPDGWRWQSSTTRDDTGGGSCELMWVTSVSVE